MATLLSEYQEKKGSLTAQAASGNMSFDQLMLYQELAYRIEVLEVSQAFCRSAPITMDMKAMINHYKLVDGYVRCIGKERRFGPSADEKQKAMRQTAANAMDKVIVDSEKRFSSFSPNSPEQYKNSICSLINTVLPVWVQLRNTYLDIQK